MSQDFFIADWLPLVAENGGLSDPFDSDPGP